MSVIVVVFPSLAVSSLVGLGLCGPEDKGEHR